MRTCRYYVVSPGGHKTGGTELAHQLVYKLNRMGLSAKIAYSESKDGVYLNDAFREYVNEYVKVEEIENSPDNTLIFVESLTYLIPLYDKCQVYVWWMSVDNYYNGRNWQLSIQEHGVLKAVALRVLSAVGLRRRLQRCLPLSEMSGVTLHLVQSAYAESFLKENGIDNIKYLTDYINKDYLDLSSNIDIKKKQDIIIYNPHKGGRFTKKIIRECEDIKFIPLNNLSNLEVADYMAHAKIYIDFGNHPGKDRLPREAAMMMCCIITGTRGSAGFYEDIPIKDNYKIADKEANLTKIHREILETLQNYETKIKEFAEYRQWIATEESRFDQEIHDIFCTH